MKATFAALLLASPALAGSPPKDPPTTTAQLVGTWALTAPRGQLPEDTHVTVEFTADGSLILRVAVGKAVNSVSRGTYRADTDKIDYTMNSGSGSRKETLKIVSLTADKLIVVDPDKKREEFRRVENTKK